jgi:deazaflavin-dependent oxidoreductase (nitroreductase family)
MLKQQIQRIFQVLFWTTVVISSIVGAFLLLVIAFARVMGTEGLSERLRAFNKSRFNPMVLKIAGKNAVPFAIVKHIGRRSGQEYSTPVGTRPMEDGFVIPLSYGREVDWCRNIMTAGVCTLVWNDQEYVLAQPEIISLSQAQSAYPLLARIIFSAGGIKEHLLLHQAVRVPESLPARL